MGRAEEGKAAAHGAGSDASTRCDGPVRDLHWLLPFLDWQALDHQTATPSHPPALLRNNCHHDGPMGNAPAQRAFGVELCLSFVARHDTCSHPHAAAHDAVEAPLAPCSCLSGWRGPQSPASAPSPTLVHAVHCEMRCIPKTLSPMPTQPESNLPGCQIADDDAGRALGGATTVDATASPNVDSSRESASPQTLDQGRPIVHHPSTQSHQPPPPTVPTLRK